MSDNNYKSDIEATVRGWLSWDAELKTTQAGKKYAMAAVALGVQQSSDPEFVTVFIASERGIQKLMALKKGDRLLAAGSLQRGEYTDKKTGEQRRSWKLNADWVG